MFQTGIRAGPVRVTRSMKFALTSNPAAATESSKDSDMKPQGVRQIAALIESLSIIDIPQGFQRRHFKGTTWFQLKTIEPMRAPPVDLSACPDLREGDLFYNRVQDGRYALWLWEGKGGKAIWKPVLPQYKRQDGKILTLTQKRKNPSWVSVTHARKMLGDNE